MIRKSPASDVDTGLAGQVLQHRGGSKVWLPDPAESCVRGIMPYLLRV